MPSWALHLIALVAILPGLNAQGLNGELLKNRAHCESLSSATNIAIHPTSANFNVSAVEPGRFVTSADGTHIFAQGCGNRSQPAVVFIHGFGLGSFAFDQIFEDPEWLERAYLVRYDVRGHGLSDKPTTPASWESQRLAEDFDAVVQSFGLHQPFVLGWSLGASHIADILSFHTASYLSGVIYDAPVAYLAAANSILSPAAAATLPDLTQNTDVAAFQSTTIAFVNLCHPALPWDFYLANLGAGIAQPRAIANLSVRRTQNETGLLEAGRSGQLPLLVIFGGEDKNVVRQGVVDALAGWDEEQLSVVDIPGAEHYTWISAPRVVRESVLEWIAARVAESKNA